jgi:hypothetical protein
MLSRYLSILLFAAAALFITACAPTNVQATQQYSGEKLPKPTKILVYDFAITPEEVKLNSALGARIANRFKSASQSDQELAIGRSVAASLSKELIKDLRARGFAAEHADGSLPTDGNIVLITGHFLDVNQGNRLRRDVIGFGAGSSNVTSQVQVLDNVAQPHQLLLEFSTSAQSSHKPGAAELAGAGIAAGSSVVTSLGASTSVAAATEALGASVEDDAKRTAKEIDKQLLPFFVRQGWATQ